MGSVDATGGRPHDIKNSENDKPGPPTLPRGVSFDIPRVESQPHRKWTWWQIISGKRDEFQAFRGRGWKTSPFVFLGQFGEAAGSFGLEFNVVNYFLYVLHVPLATSATMATNFIGASYCAPLAGAFFADAFLGRFLAFALGCIIYLTGMVMFTLQARDFWSLLPKTCNIESGNCEKPDGIQIIFLWVSLVILAVGSGFVKPTAAPFGADQFERSKTNHMSQLRHYFNWYYFSVCFAMVTAIIFIIYIQDNVSFGWGGIVSIILLAMAIFFFLCGSPFYIHRPPTGSPLTQMAQVFVAAFRKWNRAMPDNPDNLYEDRKLDDKESLNDQLELLEHTDGFRFLDKAAILDDADEEPDSRRRYSPWRLAPVHRVEELKMMLKIFPIWLATVPVSLVTIQRGTFLTQQAFTMDRRVGGIQIPAASMLVFSIGPLLFFIPLYDMYISKFIRRFTGHPKGLSDLQRIGVGTFINIVTSIVTVFIEKKRRRVAYDSGVDVYPLGAELQGKPIVLPISVFWLVPQLVLMGLAELFVIIGQIEFYYDQAPESLRSLSNALFWFSLGIGSLTNSFIITTIQAITAHHCPPPLAPGLPSACGWIQGNYELGRLDYFYWFVASLTLLNFIYFLVVSRWYISKKKADFQFRDEPIITSPVKPQSTT